MTLDYIALNQITLMFFKTGTFIENMKDLCCKNTYWKTSQCENTDPCNIYM